MCTNNKRPRKWLYAVIASIYLFLHAPLSMADGIVNKQTQSSDYARTFARHAATDSLDIVVYNPAGLMKLENGVHAKLDSIIMIKHYTNMVPGYGELEDTNHLGAVPAFFSLYKRDQWATFFAFTVPGGGGIVDYNKGNATTVTVANSVLSITPYNTIDSMSLDAKSVYLGYTFGLAYAFNEIWSVSTGARFIDANIEVNSDIVLSINGLTPTIFSTKYDQHAEGWGGFLGINISPSEQCNIGLTYKSNTRLVFDQTIDRDDLNIVNSFTKKREDLPGLLGIGVSYKLLKDLKLDVSYTLFLEKDATWDGRLEGQGNSYDISSSLEYSFNEHWKFNVAYRKTEKGISPDKMGAESPELDSFTISSGAVWSPSDTWTFNLGLGKATFEDATTSQNITYDKNVWAFLCGVQRKF